VADVVAMLGAIAEPGGVWDQGDIVQGVYFAAADTELPAVLVTPACDIEQSKVDLWTFVALYPDTEVARAIVAKDLESWRKSGTSTLSANQKSSLAKTMRDLLGHRYPRYHWLPVRIGDHTAHVADFSWVTALPAEEVRRSVRIATLRSSWREQLPARYASFMARVGTVDFKPEDVAREVDRLVMAITAS
jgi:hypothetical protein